ncbi:exopolysaccharide biosynthesis polyprenyl glycosylphosphotransferase [Streptomyces sp. JJ38]|uniref:exopolysaccharide biosynthesis polyprenyl glycosylphosphotransferase n=1 Tax=Streptomyces sp. JJ38 TaxID=2738128 RepID=UPI001C55D9BF|nr:exopolysaccharide biosynthesis polyprenyl glycosylphosphotransferase [Streptomyces sp. JJ38]MBW1599872.1 exopolysaccharide biosynthesis polyprenyl glycosylphosphotransferase [Streptomyces sp. JJ38]
MTTESTDAAGAAPTTAVERETRTVFPPPRPAPHPGGREPRSTRRRPRRHDLPLATADCLAGTGAATFHTLHGAPVAEAAGVLAPALALTLLLHARGGLYRPALPSAATDVLPALLWRTAAAWGLSAAAWAGVSPGRALPLSGLAALVAGHVLLACAGRGAVLALRRRAARLRPRSTLLVGDLAAGTRLAAALHAQPRYGLRPVGLVPVGPPAHDGPPRSGTALPVLESEEDIHRAVVQNAVREAVLTRHPDTDPDAARVARLLTEHDCDIWFADAEPRDPAHSPGTVRGPATHLWGFACRRLDPPPSGRAAAALKRALDLALAAPALVLAAPVLLACAAAVRLADGPGVLFRQERVGLHGRPFTLLKFRTLRPADAYESATRWSVAEDGRMSGVGRLLRRTSLDELPQLWNVLRGDMSLVGPRPERPYFVAKFSDTYPGYSRRHRMPAGLTGLAQVHGLRGDTSIEDRARFDNHYIASWTLWQDVRIMARTATSLFRHGGS